MNQHDREIRDAVTVTLKEHFDARLAEMDRRLTERQDRYEEVMDVRLEKLNELRAEVLTDRGRFVTREAATAGDAALVARIENLEARASYLMGAIGILGILIAANVFKIWLG